MVLEQYLWIVVIHGIIAWLDAWGIGANDVANAFGTSVGSKTLKLWQAVCVAAVFEFLGAMLLGGAVVKTISGGIAKSSSFADTPGVFMYGMMCAEAGAMVWIIVATYFELPVSTTHSIVGGIMGFALVYGGADAIIWSASIPDFPYVTGVVPIVISWITSPLFAAILAGMLYFFVRTGIMRRTNSTKLAYWFLPVIVLITIYINVFFVCVKGAKSVNGGKGVTAPDGAWISAIAGGGAALLSFGLWPVITRRIKKYDSESQNEKDMEADYTTEGTDRVMRAISRVGTIKETDGKTLSFFKKMYNGATAGLTTDIHKDVAHDEKIQEIHANTEKFDPKTEIVFEYLQVMSACAMSFSHGANDVANAIGTFSATYYTYVNGKVPSSSSDTYWWILLLGGSGIVVGLATYGQNIMRALGVKVVHITPSRGFCMETATSLTVAIASVSGLPVSTTHTITGATMGPALIDGGRNMNWKKYFTFFVGWVFTLVAAGLMSAAFFAQGVYSPNLPQAQAVNAAVKGMNTMTMNYVKDLNSSAGCNFNITKDTWYINTTTEYAWYSLDNVTNWPSDVDPSIVLPQANYDVCMYLNTTILPRVNKTNQAKDRDVAKTFKLLNETYMYYSNFTVINPDGEIEFGYDILP